jgi:hypothetical protein
MMLVEDIMATLHFDKVSEARDNFKLLLDAAESGRPALVLRDDQATAFVSADRLRYFLAKISPRATVVNEAGSWWVFIDGLSVSADGATLDEALDDMIIALREYADDWQDRLSVAPNHKDNWGIVQLVSLSTDDQLRQWLRGVNA